MTQASQVDTPNVAVLPPRLYLGVIVVNVWNAISVMNTYLTNKPCAVGSNSW